jgi:hypothetical protein
MWDSAGSLAVIRDKTDVARRLCLPPREIRQEDSWLGQVYGLWDSFRVSGHLPKRSDFDPVELMGLSKGRIHIVDASTDRPEGYQFRLWGSQIDHLGGDFTKRCLGEMPPTTMRKAAMEDYSDTVETGHPAYQLVYAVDNFLPKAYARLILPLTLDGRRICQLFVCINPRSVPEVSEEDRPVHRERPQLRLV